MYLVQVYGSGCPKCNKTAEVIEKACKDAGIEIMLEKVFDPEAFARAGILRPPGIMVNGELKFYGNIPKPELIRSWFDESEK